MPHGVKIAGRAAPPMLALALLVGHAIAANPAAAKDPQASKNSSGQHRVVVWNGETANVGGGWVNPTRSTFTFWKKVVGNPVQCPLNLQCNGPIFDTPEQASTRIDALPDALDGPFRGK